MSKYNIIAHKGNERDLYIIGIVNSLDVSSQATRKLAQDFCYRNNYQLVRLEKLNEKLNHSSEAKNNELSSTTQKDDDAQSLADELGI